MTDTDRRASLRHALDTFGDGRETPHWPDGDPDYVDALGLTRDDVPQLLEVAREWLEPFPEPEADEDYDPAVFAPMHAWRGLAQLRAPEAVALLIAMTGPMDERGDDWHLEEFPTRLRADRRAEPRAAG